MHVTFVSMHVEIWLWSSLRLDVNCIPWIIEALTIQPYTYVDFQKYVHKIIGSFAYGLRSMSRRYVLSGVHLWVHK